MKTFEVKGKIQGKARPRATTKGGYTRVYTPKKSQAYEDLIKSSYVDKYGTKPTDKAVKVAIEMYFAIPKNTPKYKREKMLVGKILPTKKPDIDNVIKSVLDGLNGVAYVDDKQVTEVKAHKVYAEKELLIVKIF